MSTGLGRRVSLCEDGDKADLVIAQVVVSASRPSAAITSGSSRAGGRSSLRCGAPSSRASTTRSNERFPPDGLSGLIGRFETAKAAEEGRGQCLTGLVVGALGCRFEREPSRPRRVRSRSVIVRLTRIVEFFVAGGSFAVPQRDSAPTDIAGTGGRCHLPVTAECRAFSVTPSVAGLRFRRGQPRRVVERPGWRV